MKCLLPKSIEVGVMLPLTKISSIFQKVQSHLNKHDIYALAWLLLSNLFLIITAITIVGTFGSQKTIRVAYWSLAITMLTWGMCLFECARSFYWKWEQKVKNNEMAKIAAAVLKKL